MLVVTPNTCIDVTTWLPVLVPGSVSRASRTEVTAGGKGVNVCRTLRALGVTPRLVGLAPVADPRLSELLAAEGCDFLPVPHTGEARLALILLEDSGRVTVVNGRGPEPHEWDHDTFLGTIVGELAATGPAAVLCSGSLPPDVPVDLYGEVVAAAHAAGIPAFVDAAPAVLGASLASGPDLVSPNVGEVESLLHGRTDEHVEEQGDDLPERCVAASRELHARGARRAVVTAGSHGAALTTAGGSWWVDAVHVEVANPIGAGDSFLAGTAHALTGGADDVTAVRHGMAVAAAAVQHERGGMLHASLVDGLLARLPQGVPA
ncbi:1-phosphofructokinase [Fodinibacter luteus]|uniref:1-phosphofructokinase n=1 Tax=Fodinibacter luteus TaxID=552064 RepID=A0ABP8K009_9MICO